jgi:hypothetical protein
MKTNTTCVLRSRMVLAATLAITMVVGMSFPGKASVAKLDAPCADTDWSIVECFDIDLGRHQQLMATFVLVEDYDYEHPALNSYIDSHQFPQMGKTDRFPTLGKLDVYYTLVEERGKNFSDFHRVRLEISY